MAPAKILCPLDFSAASHPLVTYAAALAQGLGAELCLLHVQEEPALRWEKPLTDVASELRRYQTLAEQARAPCVTTQLRQGVAAAEITHVARETSADLIVIGSHGLTHRSRFLMGSTAERVMRTAFCTTLLLRPPI